MGVVLVYTPCWSLVGGVDGWRCVGVLAGPRGISNIHDNTATTTIQNRKHLKNCPKIMTLVVIFYVHMCKLLGDVKMPALMLQ
jgi:hypothetical protein